MNYLKSRSLVVLSLLLVIVSDAFLLIGLKQFWLIPTTIFLLVPGYLLLMLMPSKKCNPLSGGLFSFGLSIFLLLTTGLLINELHWIVGLSRPLTPHNLLLGLNCVILIEILLLATIGKQSTSLALRIYRPRPADIYILVTSLIIIASSVFGANLLNSSGSNSLAIASTVLVGLMPLYIIFSRNHISQWSYIIALPSMAISLLFLSSLRGSFLSGSDVLNEFHAFQIVVQQGFWNISQTHIAYNSCLSVTILPRFLSTISGRSGLYVFRVIIQLIFSFSPLIVFVIVRQFIKPTLAFLGAVSFLAFNDFISSMPNHVRQEIALLFFVLMILAITSREFSLKARKTLMLLFGLAMVVSHYSTAYIAVMLLIGCVIVQFSGNSIKSEVAKKYFISNKGVVVSGYVTLVLVLSTIFWYSQIFTSTSGPITYIKTVTSQIILGRYDNQQTSGTSLQSQFNIFTTPASNIHLFDKYVKNNTVDTKNYSPRLLSLPVTTGKLTPVFMNNLLQILTQIWDKGYKFLALAGMLFFIFARKRLPKRLDGTYRGLVVASALVIAISFVLPSFDLNYGQDRLFQQLLVILAGTLVYVTYTIFGYRKVLTYHFLAIFLGVYVLISGGLLGQISGGAPIPLQFNNYGDDYDRYYVHNSEVLSAKWLENQHGPFPIYGDVYAINRINLVTTDLNPIISLVPSQIANHSFIYYDYSNTMDDVTYASYENNVLSFAAPTTYLQLNTNKVYDNGSSQVYEKP